MRSLHRFATSLHGYMYTITFEFRKFTLVAISYKMEWCVEYNGTACSCVNFIWNGNVPRTHTCTYYKVCVFA